jgi:hypothetical protein
MSDPVVPTHSAVDEKADVAHNEHADKIDGDLDAIDPIAEKKLLRKVDLHVVPPLLILFLLVFLDRVNIGNAKIQGMTTELHMQGHDYNICSIHLFHPLHTSGSPQQHNHQESRPFQMALHYHVSLGRLYRQTRTRPQFCWLGGHAISSWNTRSRPCSWIRLPDKYAVQTF